MTTHQPGVAIVGAGFGGLRAARALRHAPVNIVVIDRRNYHLFQPLLLANTLGVKQGRLGRIVVTPSLQIPDHPEAFVIGDAAYVESDGNPLPMVAPVAVQQADIAATNIIRLLNGQPPLNFVYKDPGSLATIGRNAAVAHFGKLQFRGFIAWALWLTVHIILLIGFRNRLVVLINWAWDYLFYDRAVRLISPE